jgi:hypothetical protein
MRTGIVGKSARCVAQDFSRSISAVKENPPTHYLIYQLKKKQIQKLKNSNFRKLLEGKVDSLTSSMHI